MSFSNLSIPFKHCGALLNKKVDSLDYSLHKTGENIKWMGRKISRSSVVDKVGFFIRNEGHAGRLLSYAAGWAVIILCAGFIYGFPKGSVSYGFKSISLPLVIGMSCGFGAGILGATLKQAIPKRKRDTIWGGLNSWLNHITDPLTRQILLSVSVTVMLAVSTVFPYVGGSLVGIVIGDHLITKIIHRVPLGPNQKTVKSKLGKLEALEKRADKTLEATEKEITKLKEEINALKTMLNEKKD